MKEKETSTRQQNCRWIDHLYLIITNYTKVLFFSVYPPKLSFSSCLNSVNTTTKHLVTQAKTLEVIPEASLCFNPTPLSVIFLAYKIAKAVHLSPFSLFSS